MAYTINQLAKLSGVSTRTLRFYDEIALLKPAYYGDNQYRYYKEEQLLMLQQILFFRKLGFPLNDIQRVMSSDDFDKVESLKTHKSALQSTLERTETLIKTIDKTILHLEGKLRMRTEDMFEGFDPVKQQEHEKYMLETGLISQEQIDETWRRVGHWGKYEWESFKATGETLNLALAKAMSDGLKVDSDEVQQLIQQHYDWINNFWTPTKETYLNLAHLYLDHPDYRDFYNRSYPNLVNFVVEAITYYAQHHLGVLK